MGCVKNITADTFPAQFDWVGGRVKVCFHYAPPDVMGTIVRWDIEDPGVAIIKLDDGRFVLATECQHSAPVKAADTQT